jgi:hypothetical protein
MNQPSGVDRGKRMTRPNWPIKSLRSEIDYDELQKQHKKGRPYWCAFCDEDICTDPGQFILHSRAHIKGVAA